MSCQGGIVESSTSRPLLETVESTYMEGGVFVLAGLGGLLGLGLLTALCCCRYIRKDVSVFGCYFHLPSEQPVSASIGEMQMSSGFQFCSHTQELCDNVNYSGSLYHFSGEDSHRHC